MSLNLILPFLRPIAHYVTDPGVSDILVNSDGSVWVERDGQLSPQEERMDHLLLRQAIQQIARMLGADVDERRPLLDSRLPDGSRVSATVPPASVGNGSHLAIRKFQRSFSTLAGLVSVGGLTQDQADYLSAAVRAKKTILISGGIGTGKTSLLNALANEIPQSERLAIIEDTAEIKVTTNNVFRVEAQKAIENIPAVTIRQLVSHSLRNRPDRILVGEVRGEEAFDFIRAINAGHTGSLATLHANSAEAALNVLARLAMQANINIPFDAILAEVGDLINVSVHLQRQGFRRAVSQILSVSRYDFVNRCFVTNPFLGE